MFQYVALAQGTTVIELTDGISYDLASYAPGVGYQNDNDLGPVYADASDTLTFHAIGCTPAEAYAAVDAVNLLLDQAWRWADGESVTAVRLQLQAQGSALTLETVVKGRAAAAAAPVTLPAVWNETIGRYVIANVQIQFVRLGQLYDPTTVSATTTAAANPTVQVATLASAATVSSPIKTSIAFSASAPVSSDIVVLTAANASRLQIYEAESAFSLGANITATADAAAFARGGSVARYAPGALSSTITFQLSGFDTTARLISVWAAVRNNSGATNFTIRYGVRNNTNESGLSFTAPVTIAAGVVVPRFVFLGIVAAPRAVGFVDFQLTASVAASTLDIDYIVVQAVDDETSNALTLPTLVGTPLSIDPRPLAALTPIVLIDSGPDRVQSYNGRAPMGSGTTVATTILGKPSGLNFWRIMNAASSAVLNTTVTIERTTAYLSPR